MPTLNKGSWTSRFLRDKDLATELATLLDDVTRQFYDTMSHSFSYENFPDSEQHNQLIMLARALNQYNPSQLTSRNDRKAFWLNVYNLLMLHSVMTEQPEGSIREIENIFTDFHYQIDDFLLNLDLIEHGILRNNEPGYAQLTRPFKKKQPELELVLSETDPRIHMALFCACVSSAPMKAYHAHTLDKELDEVTADFLHRQVRIRGKHVHLPKCFRWYKKDFGNDAGIIAFLIKHHPDENIVRQLVLQKNQLSFSWQEFNWSLNTSKELLN